MAEKHSHHHLNPFIGDIILGANDGIITTFAIAAGSAAIELNPFIIIALAAANLIADGISMASSSYLGHQSERQSLKRQRFIELWEIKHEPHEELQEVKDILSKKGYSGEDLEKLTELITKNKNFWVDFMMQEEEGIPKFEIKEHPAKNAAATFIAFVGAGLIPVLPFIFFSSLSSINILFISAAFAAAGLFIIGSLRSILTGIKWYRSGIEMLIVGATAGFTAYAIGSLAKLTIATLF